jgi:septal ring factor EnvC (AmiA/AmiB activator)
MKYLRLTDEREIAGRTGTGNGKLFLAKLSLLLLLCCVVFSLSAQQRSGKAKELEAQRLATLADIEETNKLLSENKLTINNALNRLTLLSKQIELRKKIVSLLNEEINFLNAEIQFKESQIQELGIHLKQKKEKYAASVRKMYSHKNSRDDLLFILSAQNFSQSLLRIRYLKEYSNWRKKEAGEIMEKQQAINVEKMALLKSRKNKLALLEGRKTEEKRLIQEESARRAEVKLLEKDKKKLQNELALKQRQADALNQQIEKIIIEETNRAAREAKAANASKVTKEVKTAKETKETKVTKAPKAANTESAETRVSEIEGGYAMTTNELLLSSNFNGNKGKLPFPLKGAYKVVEYFGVHQHKELSYVTTRNNGIEIETTPGNDARVVYDGVVSRIFLLPGYNNSIIVRHGNYLTLYSNLEQVYVKQGDKVNTGQALGKIFTDRENSNSTLLHFELWKEQTKLDPLPWLKK